MKNSPTENKVHTARHIIKHGGFLAHVSSFRSCKMGIRNHVFLATGRYLQDFSPDIITLPDVSGVSYSVRRFESGRGTLSIAEKRGW
jgi:hypothetical protein